MLASRTDHLLARARYPRANGYDPSWIFANEMGPNALWLTEWLCQAVELDRGMRVLDLGCGRAMTSIFLAREFGVQVWANDLWIAASDNWERVREAGLDDRVFPIHAEAHALPYAHGFFDAILSVDSYHYFGTDDLYLGYVHRFLRPGGAFGIAVPGLTQDLPDTGVPEHLESFWDPKECFSFHTAHWWRRHLDQSQVLDIGSVDLLAGGCAEWLGFLRAQKAAQALNRHWQEDELEVLAADRGQYLGFIRVAGRRRRAAGS